MSRSAAARLDEQAPLFAALGDGTRLHIVARLARQGPLSIARLHEGVPLTRQAITKHLQALVDAGLVHDRKAGRERIFELRPKRLGEARRALDHIEAQWDAALERLRAFVEEDG